MTHSLTSWTNHGIYPREFVALDLETTGLDPATDTIIEIAAVRFTLAYREGGYSIDREESRSMLVDPARPLPLEVTTITGITESMLHEKPRWDEIRDRVRDFITTDTIILGHNVLFDTAMLATHGIDLSTHTTLDTFELAELFSQEVASLNLAFLADHYGLSLPGEHRALDDTRMSIRLFLYYLEHLSQLSDRDRLLLARLAHLDSSRMLSTLLEIGGIASEEKSSPFSIHSLVWSSTHENLDLRSPHAPSGERDTQSISWEMPRWRLYDIDGARSTELDLIAEVSSSQMVLLLTIGKKQGEELTRDLSTRGVSTVRTDGQDQFLSLDRLQYRLDSLHSFDRKYIVFLAKLALWAVSTHTWRLSELRYYNDEFRYLEEFRSVSDDLENPYWLSHLDSTCGSRVLVRELSDFLRSIRRGESIPDWVESIMIRDILRLEEAVRSAWTDEIRFSTLSECIDSLHTFFPSDPWVEKLAHTLDLLEWLFLHHLDRPEGPSPNPPGRYGETYHIGQLEYWSRLGRWGILALDGFLESWEEIRPRITREQARELYPLLDRADRTVSLLSRLIHTRVVDTSLIFTIQDGSLSISLIPRNVRAIISQIFSGGMLRWQPSNTSEISSPLFERNTLGYGYGIGGVTARAFLRSEITSSYEIESRGDHRPGDIRVLASRREDEISILLRTLYAATGTTTVILSTNLKQIREIGTLLRSARSLTGYEVLIQWLSGGKEKMLGNFLKSSKKKILVGLIDTWRDESAVWRETDLIALMKVPFDPPTDIRFLARTVGMSNNFETYSLPITLMKMNLLFGRIRSSDFSGRMICLDARLESTSWGRTLQSEFIAYSALHKK